MRTTRCAPASGLASSASCAAGMADRARVGSRRRRIRAAPARGVVRRVGMGDASTGGLCRWRCWCAGGAARAHSSRPSAGWCARDAGAAGGKEYSVCPAHTHGLAKVWLAEARARCGRERARRSSPQNAQRGTLAHCWKARGELARAAGDLVEAEIQYRRSLAQARQLSMAPVCEACEAALAALAALQAGSSVERNVEV